MKKMRYIFISDWSSLKCLMSRKRALRKSGEKGDLSKYPVSIWKYFLFNIWKIWKCLEDFFCEDFFFSITSYRDGGITAMDLNQDLLLD